MKNFINGNEVKKMFIDGNEVKSLYKNGVKFFENFFSATGGTITEVGNYKIHTFLTNGTFIVEGKCKLDVFIVGGGGGGSSGGGGGGGLIYVNNIDSQAGISNITVGSGGIRGTLSPFVNGNNGGDSSYNSYIAIGGGGGGRPDGDGSYGGSGGGAGVSSYKKTFPGLGNIGQGFDGGDWLNNTVPWSSGGGGGAAEKGGNALSNLQSGSGGNGLLFDISGINEYYAGGGAGSNYLEGGNYGNGGLGGGGSNNEGVNGTGGGGSGARHSQQYGFNGGSGIVIIRYLK